jgi:hypothetical protein
MVSRSCTRIDTCSCGSEQQHNSSIRTALSMRGKIVPSGNFSPSDRWFRTIVCLSLFEPDFPANAFAYVARENRFPLFRIMLWEVI